MKKGVKATLINPRVVTQLDVKTLNSLKRNHSLVVTLEDGVIDGGFGEKVARFYGDSVMKVLVRGAAKKFVDRYDYGEFLKVNRLTVKQLAADTMKLLK